MDKTTQQFFTQSELEFIKVLVLDYLEDWDYDSETGVKVLNKLKQVCQPE